MKSKKKSKGGSNITPYLNGATSYRKQYKSKPRNLRISFGNKSYNTNLNMTQREFDDVKKELKRYIVKHIKMKNNNKQLVVEKFKTSDKESDFLLLGIIKNKVRDNIIIKLKNHRGPIPNSFFKKAFNKVKRTVSPKKIKINDDLLINIEYALIHKDVTYNTSGTFLDSFSSVMNPNQPVNGRKSLKREKMRLESLYYLKYIVENLNSFSNTLYESIIEIIIDHSNDFYVVTNNNTRPNKSNTVVENNFVVVNNNSNNNVNNISRDQLIKKIVKEFNNAFILFL
tara:strand:+ start:130 stop:981 length:852 start_codon:yes stop_codon:yes gene_type:complete